MSKNVRTGFPVGSSTVCCLLWSHLLSHCLCELFGFFWVHCVHRRHLSSSSRSWHSGRRSAASALSCLLRAETDRWKCLNLMVIISRDDLLSFLDNNTNHSKCRRDFMSHEVWMDGESHWTHGDEWKILNRRTARWAASVSEGMR